MPVVTVKRHGDTATIFVSQGFAFTSMGVVNRPRITLPGREDTYDPRSLSDVSWEPCTRFAIVPQLYLHMTFKNDKDETTKVAFFPARPAEKTLMYAAVQTLTAAIKRGVCQARLKIMKDRQISLQMALHPRLGAASPLRVLIDDVLCMLASFGLE